MPCNASGTISLALAVTALSLSSIALGLPMWSSSSPLHDVAKDIPGMLQHIRFTVGVWGYCINADLTQEYNHITLDQCFSFYSSRDISNALHINGTAVAATLNNAAVDMISTHAAICDLPDLGSATATLTPLSPSEYTGFISRSCGSLGKVTLAFAALSTAFGALTLLFLVLFITCCTTMLCIASFSKCFALLSIASSVVALVGWITQAKDLTSASLGVSFAFEVAAAVLYVLTFVAIVYHEKNGKSSVDTEGKIGDPSP
ncbi:hypothetical protein DYB32_001064 [Aphanomyces invadans]|uniref:Uncharacterized protein n=1 Tax=Aphanomyces invadans TaxID=157072 RepID=A0A418B7U7_9STRA|nr:hypothetical protein DYB32_001064 [Aphanomyces invadans]